MRNHEEDVVVEKRTIVQEVNESSEGPGAWGEMPTIATAEMHDMLASVVLSATEDAEVGRDRPLANRLFSGPSQKTTGSKNINSSSPFYDALHAMLENVPADATLVNAHLEEPSAYNPISKELRDSVILILTHCGFTDASNECIEVLTDVLAFYLHRFTGMLREFTDSEDLLSSPNDFVDTLNKVLQHMMVPDLDTLRRFNDELIEYADKCRTVAVAAREEAQEEVIDIKSESEDSV